MELLSGKACWTFPSIQPVLSRYHLSREPLERIVKGVELVRHPSQFKNFSQRHHYGLRVAEGFRAGQHGNIRFQG